MNLKKKKKTEGINKICKKTNFYFFGYNFFLSVKTLLSLLQKKSRR